MLLGDPAGLVDRAGFPGGVIVAVDRGKVKRAFFYVLVNTQMPSILAEVGFISNAEEENLLRKDAYRQKLAEALFQGIKRYVESRDPVI